MAQTQTDSERKRLQRERTRKHREKVKERAANDATAAEQRKFPEFNSWRTEQRLVSPGEREAFINAESVEDALQVAREFLVALGMPDVQPGETLLKLERRVVTAWLEIGAPLLSRITLKFDHSTGSTTDGFTYDFDTKWIPLDGANEVIDLTLPAIVVSAVFEVPAADTPALVDTGAPLTPGEIEAMEYRHQKGLSKVAPQLALLLKTQQDAMDAKAREISARNEKRELEKEKRLGVAYAYEDAE